MQQIMQYVTRNSKMMFILCIALMNTDLQDPPKVPTKKATKQLIQTEI